MGGVEEVVAVVIGRGAVGVLVWRWSRSFEVVWVGGGCGGRHVVDDVGPVDGHGRGDGYGNRVGGW